MECRLCEEEREKDRDCQPLNDVVVTTRPLIGITKFYKDVPEAEVSKPKCSKDLDVRVTHLVIDFSPLWVDGIGTYFLLKPVTLYREIRRVHGGRRFSQAVYAFCDWLLTLDLSEVTINERNLEHKLWLDRHRRQEQPGRIRKALDDAYETAREVGLLTAYSHDAFGLLLLELNPERCRRVQCLITGQTSGITPPSVGNHRANVGNNTPKCREACPDQYDNA